MIVRVILCVCFIFALHASAMICPDHTHECSQQATCCGLPSGGYGCCPLPNAVCCSDHIHCCPGGYTCESGTCTQGLYNVSHQPVTKEEDVVCPGSHYTCPTNSSCCTNDDGEVIGCCIEPDAVCCPGGQYCCPNGSSCNVDKGHCNDNKNQEQISQMTSSLKPLNIFDIRKSNEIDSFLRESTICPDGSSECPGGFTCCELPQGSWGCCPYPDATCCLDHLHCCPSSMTCGPTSTFCYRSGFNMTSFKTLTAIKSRVN